MIPAAWALAAVLPLAAPPKLLVNAQVDSRTVGGGLEQAFRPLVTAQAAWIGYSVPLVRGYNLGCEYVGPGGYTVPGVVHLEPPDHAIILFRVETGSVTRIRVLSPDCEIDAGGAPMHWLDDVRPAESTALLQSFAQAVKPSGTLANDRIEPLRENAIHAISVSEDPGAIELLITLARQDANPRIRRLCVTALARSNSPRALAFLDEVLKR